MDPLLLAFLELTVVMVLIMLLHSVKRLIGDPAFYLSLGLFLMLGQIVSAFGIQIDPGLVGFRIDVGNVVLTAPFLVALLLVYVLDGTLEAQRLIMGFLAVLVGYLCLSLLLATQFTLPGYTSRHPGLFEFLASSFSHGRRVVNATFIASAADLLVLPILYQVFRNWRCRLFISVLATLVFTQVIDSFVFQLMLTPTLGNWWENLREVYIARALAMVWLSILATVYLHMIRTPPQTQRPSLDIVFAFLGAYGRAEALQRDLVEWEGRYRTVVESISDWILVINRNGLVVSANAAARANLNNPSHNRRHIADLFRTAQDNHVQWNKHWKQICDAAGKPSPRTVIHDEWHPLTAAENAPANDIACLDIRISPASVHEHLVAILIGRDMTDLRNIQKEREALRERMATVERLESVGVLAGGVAHDFNNLLHAMRAGIERLRNQCNDSTDIHHQIETIDGALDRASRLTNHLLGFARQGQYHPERVLLQSITDEAKLLFEPLLSDSVDFRSICLPDPIYLHADRTQLEQVFLNLLINARDAVQERESGRIVFRGERARADTPGWEERPQDQAQAKPENFCCVRVKDDGPGIPEAVRNNIFEPFVTTKETGHGTGMGLAMAYGCVVHHGGWIHVNSDDTETEFVLFLPCLV